MDAMDGISVKTRVRANISSPALQLRDSCPLRQKQHQGGPQPLTGANAINSQVHSGNLTSISLTGFRVKSLEIRLLG